jgi:GNAT superfamily N-acetyltransferase
VRIRAAERRDLTVLAEIERAAGEAFRDVGMAIIADEDPFTDEELEPYVRDGRAWVSVDHSDRPLAYLVARVVDGNLHVDQVSVHPDHARQGIGRVLLAHAETEAASEGISALTLTTFADVPWNAPYYERCGFRVVDEAQLTPGLAAIRQAEDELWQGRWPRVCMRRDVRQTTYAPPVPGR